MVCVVISSEAEKSCGPAPAEIMRKPERGCEPNCAAARAQDFYYPDSIGCPSLEMTTQTKGVAFPILTFLPFRSLLMSDFVLTSRSHALVKKCRALQTAKGRREHNAFLIEGRNAVEAALNHDWPLQEILALPDETELSQRAQGADLDVTRAAASVIEAATDLRTPPPIIAIGTLPATVENFESDGLILIIDGANDPGNVGTMLRAADAAGASQIILSAGSADVYGPKIVRSAAGSLLAMPPVNLENRSPQNIARLLREKQIPIVTAQTRGGADAFEYRWPRRCALVLGHETRGVSAEFADAGAGVTIPIYGRAESLNVAMAATVLCYAWAQTTK